MASTFAPEASIGAFDGFDGQYGAVPYADALSDIERAHSLGDFPAEFDIGELSRRRWTTGDLSRLDEQLRREIGGGTKCDPMS